MSTKLSEGDFDGLKGLVTPEEINRVRKIVEQMDEPLRKQLKVMKEDVFGDVPYDVNIKTVTRDGKPVKVIEIIQVFHSVTNFREFAKGMSQE